MSRTNAAARSRNSLYYYYSVLLRTYKNGVHACLLVHTRTSMHDFVLRAKNVRTLLTRQGRNTPRRPRRHAGKQATQRAPVFAPCVGAARHHRLPGSKPCLPAPHGSSCGTWLRDLQFPGLLVPCRPQTPPALISPPQCGRVIQHFVQGTGLSAQRKLVAVAVQAHESVLDDVEARGPSGVVMLSTE